MGFWITGIGLALACVAVLVRAVLRERSHDVPAAAYDLQVYRDQLKDVERDLSRNVISTDEAERLRTEVSRRILAADSKMQAHDGQDRAGSRGVTLALLVVTAICVIGGASWLYIDLGAPGYPDLPRAERLAASEDLRQAKLSQEEVEARLPERPAMQKIDPDYLALVERLRETVAARPADAEGLSLLARHEAGIGNFIAARKAQAAVLALRGKEASAEDFAMLADLMVTAAQGYVSSDAELALRTALTRDPKEPRARYYLGVYMLQIDRPDAAFRLWRDLLEESRMDDPWTPTILDGIGEVALRAGVQYDVPKLSGLLPGPTQQDIDTASQMSAEDRNAMIRDMVASLSARLATQGGTAEEWARLIRAHGVLGNSDQSRAIWQEAEKVFANDPAAIDALRASASDAGVLE